MINLRTTPLSTSPETLRELTLRKILELTQCIEFNANPLPQEIGQLILCTLKDHILLKNIDIDRCTHILRSFTRKCTSLKELDLSGLPIDADLFMNFIDNYHDIVEQINISACPKLRHIDLIVLKKQLDRCKDTLHTLIVSDTLTDLMTEQMGALFPSETDTTGLAILPDLRLKTLVVHDVRQSNVLDPTRFSHCLYSVLRPSMHESLTYLDLSSSLVGDGRILKDFKNLKTLILFNCSLNYPRILTNICELENLITLDLSQEYQDSNEFLLSDCGGESKYLHDIVTRLPNLMSLDISCTNLVERKDRHISVLETRRNKPFNFLGLFHTTNATFGIASLPAKIVASEANETHILMALQAYIDRPRQLIQALGDLFNLYKASSHQDTFENVPQAIDLVLEILTRHLTQQQVIITGTAVLWYIIKINMSMKVNNDTKVMKTVISRLLDAMHYHKDVESILINGGLILLFLPDLIYEYSRVAYIALHMCREDSSRLKNFGTTLMNHLACQVSGEQKIHIGKLEAIETMMQIINIKIRENISDETLESAWCTLWNITDETIDNCRRFLNANGILAFKQCMDSFANNKDLLKNMMGLLGNVAECAELRDQFMDRDILVRFFQLLTNPVDSIECSYNACGILAHIMSDGEAFWATKLREEGLSRKVFLDEMRAVIDSWPINSKRNINYRSFEPIVRLLQPHVPGEAQYWALFALTNLTRVDPAKYCPMLVPHHGLDYLRQIANQDYATDDYVCNLARVALHQYERFESEKTLSGLEQCDSKVLEELLDFMKNSKSDVAMQEC